jgi:hypothetical protein
MFTSNDGFKLFFLVKNINILTVREKKDNFDDLHQVFRVDTGYF